MVDISWAEFWWNNITGPHVVVTKVTNALLENRSVLLNVPADLSWRQSMRSSINSAFREKLFSSEIVIELIDDADDNPEHMAPGRFILSRFATSVDRKGYRERSRTTIQEYITAKNILRNRVVWVKGVSGKNAETWIDFIRGFSKRSLETGLFVLEVQGKFRQNDAGPMELINYSEHVSTYDVQLFNGFVLDEKDEYSDQWKNYIAAVSSALCGTDAEISAELIETCRFKTDNVIDSLKGIAESPVYARRGEENPEHVLWNCRNNKISELEYRIWQAQVQILFPIIEIERVKIIRELREIIQEILDQNCITQYNEPLTDAADTELGSLCYLMSRREYDGSYSLYIPDEAKRDWIYILHKCRNNLAHVSCCAVEQVSALLNS